MQNPGRFNPLVSKSLTRSALIGSKNRSVVAFDLTFKADQTISLLHAFAKPDIAATIEDAQTASVAAAFRHYRNRNEDPTSTTMFSWRT